MSSHIAVSVMRLYQVLKRAEADDSPRSLGFMSYLLVCLVAADLVFLLQQSMQEAG